MHRKISHDVRNCLAASSGFAWCAKFLSLSHALSPATAPPLDFRMLCEIKVLVCWISSFGFLPCISDWLGKGLWSALKLGFFMYLSFNLHCRGFHKILPHSWLVSMIKKLQKTPKLAKNWLVTLARFLNVPIELKGINYYSKVFKIVSFKL